MKKKTPLKFSIERALAGSPSNFIEALKQEREKTLISILTTKTPTTLIHNRKGKGGKTFSYVTGGSFTRALNLAFNLRWNFEVKDRIFTEKQIAVLGKLSVNFKDGEIVKEQWGSAEVYDGVPLGDSFKKATTDALKKCASLLGIFGDVYGQSEELEDVDKPKYSRAGIEQALVKIENSIVSGELTKEEALKRIETGLIVVRDTGFTDLIDRLLQLKLNLSKNENGSKPKTATKKTAKKVAEEKAN